jgi:hypothetical protein
MNTKTIAALGSMLAMLIPGAVQAQALEQRCMQELEQALQEQGIDLQNVVEVEQYSPFSATGEEEIENINTWVRLEQCPDGWLVVSFDQFCNVETMYTRGGCSVAGVDSY